MAFSMLVLISSCALSMNALENKAGSSSSPEFGFSVDWTSTASSIMPVDATLPLVNQGNQAPAAIASTAKVITALTVLKHTPLTVGQSGPVFEIGASDVERYEKYLAMNGSVLPVYQGMTLTLRQALEAMLLPSANNIADSLAIWTFGSLDAYRQAAQALVQELGLSSTSVGTDASGYDPSTTSTARDLAVLAAHAMKNPAIAGIVKEPSANIPGYGPVDNTNTLLGVDGIIGLKTGTSKEARGVFLFAATIVIKGKSTMVVGAVQGAGSAAKDAMSVAQQLILSVKELSATGSADFSTRKAMASWQQSFGHLLQEA